LLRGKTVSQSQITYSVLVETLNPAQSINQSINQVSQPVSSLRKKVLCK